MPRGQHSPLRPVTVEIKLLENRIKFIDSQINKYNLEKENIQHRINFYLGKMEGNNNG